MMKEFKFWGLTFPVYQLSFIGIPAFIIITILCIYLNISKHFVHIYLGALLYIVILAILFVKRIRITISQSGTLRLYINGKEKAVGEAQQIELVRGPNVNNPSDQTPIHLMIDGRYFTFSFFVSKGIKAYSQRELLLFLIETYGLKKEFYKKTFMGTIFTYRNPAFSRDLVDEDHKQEKEIQ